MIYLIAAKWVDSWVELWSRDATLDEARLKAQAIAARLPELEVGLWGLANGASPWQERHPRYRYNIQPATGPIPASLGGIINSMYKPGKNPR